MNTLALRKESGMWDLRGLDMAPFAFFAKKQDAVEFAKARGWHRGDVAKAFNRFQVFWIIWDPCPAIDLVRIATKAPGWIDLAIAPDSAPIP
jgi:hypothetical protein